MEATLVQNQTESTTSHNINQSVQDNEHSKQTTTSILNITTQTTTNAISSSDDIICRNNKKLKKRDKSPNADSNETYISNTRTNAPVQQTLSVPVQQQTTAPNLTVNKKEKQRPESWNKIEQQIFFNALRQNGKNFESITQYFNARQKRYKLENHDGSSIQRSKEQIRHFYYRTWHKIIKYVSIPMLNTNNKSQSANSNATNKIIMNDATTFSLRDIQVKCLIAYNTLMNKSHRWNKKSAIKLVELINQGWTTIREKGKITRLRMPICKVSSKSIAASSLHESIGHQLTHNQQTSTATNSANSTANVNLPFPRTITIRLEPKNEHAYCKVHRLAQNPFLNIEIQTLQSVKFLIEFLENKWKERRVQFLEKFKIDAKKSKTTDSETKSSDTFQATTEKLIIYPSETHQIVNNLDFFESSSKLFDEHKQSIDILIPAITTSDDNNKFIDNEDETMMIDDYALIAAKNNQKKSAIQQNTSNQTAKNKTNRNYYQLSSKQLRSGLTSNTSQLSSNSTNENKDLTFVQLYLVLNKPDVIKFEYDWISSTSLRQPVLISSNVTNTESVFSSSSLLYNQNQRQRFYIDTLASVATSFLKDLQNSNQKTVNLPLPAAPAPILQQKTPPKTIAVTSKQPQQSLAIIQPTLADLNNSAQSTTHILPLDNVLQRLNEVEQSNKTRKLLSDLNSTKKRSRHRKQIMVVNTSNNNSALRNVLMPKLNFIDLSNGDNNQQQNIVLSGPVAAVARQIVNTNHSTANTNSSNSIAATPKTSEHQQQQLYTANDNNYIIVGNYNQEEQQFQATDAFDSNTNYSNLMPQFFASLTSIATENSSSSNSNNDFSTNQIEPVVVNENYGSPQTLADMSLLDLSINNTDSLFGTATQQGTANKQMKINEQNDFIEPGAFSGVSLLKVDKNINGSVCSNQSRSGNSNFSLSNRRSDIIVEWTDSMNDVSLTGILNDFQSPDKHHSSAKGTALVHVLNENSRDSIFFNMDTIMDINQHSSV